MFTAKSLWAGNIANSYDTREYSVTREFWLTIHRQFKRGYITAQRQPEAIKSKRLPSRWWDTIKKIFSSSYYGALILITFEVRFFFFFFRQHLAIFQYFKYTCLIFFFSSSFCCLTQLRNFTPSSSKVKSKTCDFVSRRRLLLLQRPSKGRKTQKANYTVSNSSLSLFY